MALKILAPQLADNPDFAARFSREGQALAEVNHPNIVTVHDFGRTGSFYYLLMEFVDGVSLRQAMTGGRLTPEQALTIVPPICEALQFAHDRGIATSSRRTCCSTMTVASKDRGLRDRADVASRNG